MGAAGERPEFDMKLPLGGTLLIFPRVYLLMYFPQGDIFARQRVFEIRFISPKKRITKDKKLYNWINL